MSSSMMASMASPSSSSEEQLSKLRKLIQVAAYTSSIRFPEYPCYYYPAFFTLQIMKRYQQISLRKLRLIPLPKKFYNLLIKNEFLKSEHYCFVSETVYEQFINDHRQLNWLNILFLNKTTLSTPILQPPQLSPSSSISASSSCSSSASSETNNRMENGNDTVVNKSMNANLFVPILQINNCLSNCIYLSENCYYNLKQKYKLNKNEIIYVKLQQMQRTQLSPQLATKSTIFIINNPYELSTDITDDIISIYFENPRILYRNYTYEILLDDLLFGTNIYSKNFSIFSQLKKLYFRCVHIESKENPFELYGIVTKGLTNVHQTTSINYPIPRQQLHDLCFIGLCPDGLMKYFRKLKSSIETFIPETFSTTTQPSTTNINGSSATNIPQHKHFLTSRNIFPIFMLQGERGCGKNTILNALALNLGVQLLNVNCGEIVSQIPSQTEAKLKNVFAKTKICQPLIICLHNFEIFGVDADGREDLRQITMFQTELHNLFASEANQYPIIVIAITNENQLKPLIQRLFLEIVKIHAPNATERLQILKWLTKKEQFSEDIYNKNIDEISLLSSALQLKWNHKRKLAQRNVNQILKSVSDKTQGFYYGDLKLLNNNSLKAMKFNGTTTTTTTTTNTSLDQQFKLEYYDKELIQMQESFADSLGAPKVPKVLWSDIGGLAKLKDEIQSSIGLPLRHMHLMGKNMRRSGILLYGPPGTGKTLVAKAVATECNLSFLAVQGPELLNMYVGQSEQNVRDVFARARSAAPCVIFLDELDSLAPNRGVAGDSGGVMDRVVSQLLAEMDGIITNDDDEDNDNYSTNKNNLNDLQQKQIFILAATNRPDLIDPALLRPGRFDKLLYVGPCITIDDKIAVLKAQLKKFTLDKKLNIKSIAELLQQEMTGADLYSICSNAWLSAVRRTISKTEKNENIPKNEKQLTSNNVIVNLNDFKTASTNFVPSVNQKDLEYFNKLKSNFSKA